MRIFIGYDPRQPIAAQVLAHSIYARASKPVEITYLMLHQLPIKRRGLTEFTFSRYLVPYLCDYEGYGLFMDADMLCLTDIHLLEAVYVDGPVALVKGKQRFEWPSLMMFRNGHEDCRRYLTPKMIDLAEFQPQTLKWARKVTALDPVWNHCVGYDEPREDARIVHFTAGIPCFPETQDCEYSKQWHDEAQKCVSTVSWQSIMGNSVHVDRVRRGMAVQQAA